MGTVSEGKRINIIIATTLREATEAQKSCATPLKLPSRARGRIQARHPQEPSCPPEIIIPCEWALPVRTAKRGPGAGQDFRPDRPKGMSRQVNTQMPEKHTGCGGRERRELQGEPDKRPASHGRWTPHSGPAAYSLGACSMLLNLVCKMGHCLSGWTRAFNEPPHEKWLAWRLASVLGKCDFAVVVSLQRGRGLGRGTSHQQLAAHTLGALVLHHPTT